MDVVLVYPHASASGIEEGIKVLPLGLAYIASVLEKKGFEVEIIDLNAQTELSNQFEDILKVLKPKIVGISCLTPFYSTVLSLAHRAKDATGAKIVVGGAHATALPEEMLKESAIDYVVIGEGEYTMLELSDCLLNNGTQPEKIDGIAYMKDKTYHRTGLRPYIKDLDELPLPARHLLPNERYHAPQFRGERITSIMASRGCLYSCIFCDYRYMMGPKLRRRSPQNVITEIEECMKQYDINYVSFRDTIFTFDEQWVSDFCQLITQKNIDIKWDCNGRVNLVTERMLHEMKQAGCNLISYGIESGDQGILDFAKKKLTVEQSINAVKMTKKAGIEVTSYFIIGLPGENRATIEKTIKLASKLDSDYTQFSLATPFPGTPLHTYARENNLIRDVSWDDYSPINMAIMRTKELDFKELEKASRQAYRRYYLSPKYILRRASKVRPENLRRNFEGLKMFIQKTSSK